MWKHRSRNPDPAEAEIRICFREAKHTATAHSAGPGSIQTSPSLFLAAKYIDFPSFCYILLYEADSAAILPFNLPYEADSAAILPFMLLYEADSDAIFHEFLPYEADHAAILLL